VLHGPVFLDSYVDKEIITRIQHPLNGRGPDLLFYLTRLAEKWHVWFYWFFIGHFVVSWRGQEGKVLAFLDLWILAVLLILTFGIRTQMSRYMLPLYPAIAIVVAYFVLHALVFLRWGKHLVSLSGGIALALFVSHRDVFLSSNSDLRALGLAVQRYREDSQSVVAFRITEPGLIFYCRRPVQWVWRPAELGPGVQ
jgi:hypothetical protein